MILVGATGQLGSVVRELGAQGRPVPARVRTRDAGLDLAGGGVAVVSAAEVFDVTNLERVQADDGLSRGYQALISRVWPARDVRDTPEN